MGLSPFTIEQFNGGVEFEDDDSATVTPETVMFGVDFPHFESIIFNTDQQVRSLLDHPAVDDALRARSSMTMPPSSTRSISMSCARTSNAWVSCRRPNRRATQHRRSAGTLRGLSRAQEPSDAARDEPHREA